MERSLSHDPSYVRTRNREMALAPALPELNAPEPSYHLWKTALPAGLEPGIHRIEVETVDMYQRVFRANRILRVTP